ncbi:MAG TPA: MgtC/SapB family protein [Burkholderiaceae bacterium]|jgi:putative Mg2+ transporter-C (MgtC) family protein
MLSNVELLSRLALAAVLGSVIGIERERLQWTAGLRTHMLVCVGSALIMLVSLFGFGDVLGQDHVVLDPSRVAAQVVSGIGFLGAGAILFRQDKIRGLTTAASLWTVAAVGLAVGGGLYTAAVGGTAIIFGILAGLKPLERRYWSTRGGSEIALTVDREAASLAMLESVLTTAGIAVRTVSIQPGDAAEEDDIVIGVHRPTPEAVLAVMERLKQAKGVRSAAIRH